MALAFINYRRDDASQAAQALYAQLEMRFGQTSIFLDVSSIKPGEIWPERLKKSLKLSSVLLVVIGPKWLSAHDDFFQRKIDCENDWVRNEIYFALTNNIPIIPVQVDGANLPASEALPSSLRKLLDSKAIEIRHENWNRDFSYLIDLLVSSYGFIDNHMKISYPERRVKKSPLSATELNASLNQLPSWQPVESLDPHNYPKSRQELRRLYQFDSFEKAINFMKEAVTLVKKHGHHPRWENQWKSVTVYLSTWDIGSQISILDIELAKELDSLHSELKRR